MHSINSKSRVARWALSGSVLAMTTAIAMAATPAAAASDDTTVGEVVVTAQFREQNVQQTPIAITAVNAQMLEQRSQTSIQDVANQAPNVTLKRQGAAFGPSLGASIRGIGQYDFNPALEPGVGMYVDDVYYSTLTGSVLDLLDLDRVEILRGPQGTLAGKNSIGGAIKLYSKKPTGDGGGYVQATYGGLSRMEVRAGADFTIVPDKLFMRISGVSKHQDGYVTRLDYACANPGSGLPTYTSQTNCVLGKEGGINYSAVRAMVRWVASDNIEVNLNADFTADHSQGPATTLLYANNPAPWVPLNGVPYDSRFVPTNKYVSYATFYQPAASFGGLSADALSAEDKSDYKGWGVAGTIDWKLAENISLKSVTAFRGYSSDWSEDNDVSPLALNLGLEHLTHHQVSEEVRLNGGLFSNAVEYTLGGFYFSQKTTYATHQDIQYTPFVLDFLGNDPVVSHTKAGFAHVVWHVTDKLDAIGGVRYTDEDKDYHFVRVNRDGSFNPIVGGADGAVGHYQGSKWDYRASLDYQWTPDFMTYVEYSTGFKGGGIDPRPFFGPGPGCPDPAKMCQVQPFGPETLTAYELGFKSTLFDRRMRFNAAAFYNQYKGVQLVLTRCDAFSPFPGAPCAMPQNAGNATIKGFEAETEIHPVDGLMIDASMSYIDFKYDLASIAPAVGSLTTIPGATPTAPFTPKWKWSAGIQYEIPMSGMGSLTPRLDASYQGSLFTGAQNTALNRIGSYTLANARLTWKSPDRDWEAALEVTNIANTFYYVTKFDLSSLAGFTSGQPSIPREWAVTVKRRF